jgi:hypothetical protein
LELVKQSTYRTWIADHGRLAGDYAIPGIYQLRLVGMLLKEKLDVFAKARDVGVKLPQDLKDLETNPLSVSDLNKLCRDRDVKKAYDHIVQNVLGKDAEFVIRFKSEQKQRQAYEIGLIPNPLRPGEFAMMTDFFNQGNGLLRATGVGMSKTVSGKTVWGQQLKTNYLVAATESTIQKQIAIGNPEYGSYSKRILENGNIVFDVQPR